MPRTPGAVRRKQEIEALQLSNQGAGIDEIAETLGVSRATADRRVREALGRIPVRLADTYRRQAETRINAWMQEANRLLAGGDLSTADTLKVISLLATLERDRVRLLGIAVPAAVVVQHEMNGGQ